MNKSMNISLFSPFVNPFSHYVNKKSDITSKFVSKKKTKDNCKSWLVTIKYKCIRDGISHCSI